jgi:hypothetical protein
MMVNADGTDLHVVTDDVDSVGIATFQGIHPDGERPGLCLRGRLRRHQID